MESAKTLAESKLDVTIVPCHEASFTPQIHDFYGDAEAILSNIDATPMRLSERRMYALAVQNEQGAEFRLFEQLDGDTWAVSTWRGDGMDSLRSGIGDMMLRNKGLFCVGEQTKAVLAKLGIVPTSDGVVPAPHSARAAFSHPIRSAAQEGYARVTVIGLC